jgi:hypothetical protein
MSVLCVTSNEIILSVRVVSNIEFETFFKVYLLRRVRNIFFPRPGGKSASLDTEHIRKSFRVSSHVPRSLLKISSTSVRRLLERKALFRRLL